LSVSLSVFAFLSVKHSAAVSTSGPVFVSTSVYSDAWMYFKFVSSKQDDTTIFRKVYRNRAKQLLFVLLAPPAERSNAQLTILHIVLSNQQLYEKRMDDNS